LYCYIKPYSLYERRQYEKFTITLFEPVWLSMESSTRLEDQR
jgi:hypothetical protein